MSGITHRIVTAALLAAVTASASPALAAAPPATAAQNKVISIVERFKNYSGPRTPAALAALFTAPTTAKVIQKPELILSDGISTIKVTVDTSVTDGSAPNFAVIEGTLVSNKKSTPGAWLLEVLPDKRSLKCILVVLTENGIAEFPLTVATPLAPEIDLSAQGFDDYLGSQSVSSTPRLDLNADGKRDYLDDYIFTANFLARKMADPHDPTTRNQRARELTPQRLLKPAPMVK